MKILMTGAAGFLGVGMVEALAPKHTLRLMDVVPYDTQHEERMVDKYGRHLETVNWQFIDRRDIGDAVDAALGLPDLGCEVFYVLGHPDADARADMVS